MAKSLNEARITTASARSKLAVGEFAHRLDADAALWYRKGKRGGVWFARWRNHGPGANYKQAPIGPANDVNDKPIEGVLTYQQAVVIAGKTVKAGREEAKAAADGPAPTVRLAVEAYIKARDDRDSKRRGRPVRSDASRRLTKHVLGQPARGKAKATPAAPLADIALHALQDTKLVEFCAVLPATMKAATKQRLVNDLRAALNAAYDLYGHRLPANFPLTIRKGFKADKHTGDDDAVPMARDNQILTDAQIGRLLKAAREIDEQDDWNGDLFRLVVVLAATGARFSQVARLRVADVQRANGRIMMPTSRKGNRKNKAPSIPVPVGKDVLDALLPATTGCKGNEPLLERWRYKQTGPVTWERTGRLPWDSSSEMARPWNDIRERAELPEVIPYALRHSSIVKGIRANLPVRLVAALHDTSIVMIERHYAKWITTGLEDMVRAAIVPLIPAADDGNVVAITAASARSK